LITQAHQHTPFYRQFSGKAGNTSSAHIRIWFHPDDPKGLWSRSFYRPPDVLLVAQPTASKHWSLKTYWLIVN